MKSGLLTLIVFCFASSALAQVTPPFECTSQDPAQCALEQAQGMYSDLTVKNLLQQKIVEIDNFYNTDRSSMILRLTGKNRVAIECHKEDGEVYEIQNDFPFSKEELNRRAHSVLAGLHPISQDERYLLFIISEIIDMKNPPKNTTTLRFSNISSACLKLEPVLSKLTTYYEDLAFSTARSKVNGIEIAPDTVTLVRRSGTDKLQK